MMNRCMCKVTSGAISFRKGKQLFCSVKNKWHNQQTHICNIYIETFGLIPVGLGISSLDSPLVTLCEEVIESIGDGALKGVEQNCG